MMYNDFIKFYALIFAFGSSMFGIFVYIYEKNQIYLEYLFWKTHILEDSYDYIIVGCGTAGSIVALRLSEEKNNKVLVLEAGAYANSLFDIPAVGPLLQMTSADWQYRTVPQNNACLGLKNNVSAWPMGRIVGGTGRLNFMIYSRGHPNDYYEWYKHDTDFSYEHDILPYFKKSEMQLGKYNNNTKYHSSYGPLPVSDLPMESPVANAILEGADYLGYYAGDLHGLQNEGFMKVQLNLKSGRRWTPVHTLIEGNPPNVNILTNSYVNNILFHDNFEAYAVNYTHLEKNYVIQARKGVILSAGTIGTPKILMLSGIGPKEHLMNLGIPVKQNLPVGLNLQDHVTTGLDLVIINQTLPVNMYTMLSPVAVWNYFMHGTGTWTSNGCEVIAIVNTDKSTQKRPDLELMVIPGGLTLDAGIQMRKILSISDKLWNDYFAPLSGQMTVSILSEVLHPKSRGYVRLKDTDPKTLPEINPNYLKNKDDIRVLLKGIELIKQLIQTEPMKKLGAKFNNRPIPGCEEHEFDTKSYWECYVRSLTLSGYHPVGTCKMGLSNDKTSVVDYSYRVHNTNKLYVADASVMPDLVSGNPNAVVAMIAEKAADAVKMLEYESRKKCDRNVFLLADVC